MKVFRHSLVAAVLLLGFSVCRAQTIPDDVGKSSNGLPPALVNVGFDPQLNAQIPLDALFADEYGESVTLRSFSGKKPMVLAFVYFTCPCSAIRSNKPSLAR